MAFLAQEGITQAMNLSQSMMFCTKLLGRPGHSMSGTLLCLAPALQLGAKMYALGQTHCWSVALSKSGTVNL